MRWLCATAMWSAALVGAMAGPALPASVPTSWAVETRIAEVEIRAAEGLLISGNDLELLDPETGENRLRLILFDGARRFSAAFAGTRPMVLIIEVRDLFSARGFGPDIYALELAYRLEAENSVLAASTWRSIEHRIPDIGVARTSLAAAVQRDLSDWMAALDCGPGRCATVAAQADDPDLARAPGQTGPLAADAPPPRPEPPARLTAQTAPAGADPATAQAAPIPEEEGQAPPAAAADRPQDAVAALLRHERSALQRTQIERAARDEERADIDQETAPPEALSEALPEALSEAPTGAPSEDPAKITDDSVVIAAPGPDATLRAAQEDLSPTARARAEADLPRPRPVRQPPTPGRNTAALAASPVSAATTPQPGLGEARWIGSTDAAPADP
ncbi:MAG: hypothetical protein AAGD12_12020, partial [Pseudomonadota bacterium]